MNKFRLLLCCLGWAGALSAWAVQPDFEEEYEFKQWKEVEVQLPMPPKGGDLISFYVSPATDNQFFVDTKSLSVGKDGVVRYTLVVRTGGGADNISFEGMRCETRERRLYAFGRSDGTWSKSRSNTWERVENSVRNRHHAALFFEYFCPGGTLVFTADEALDALRRGGHPLVQRR